MIGIIYLFQIIVTSIARERSFGPQGPGVLPESINSVLGS